MSNLSKLVTVLSAQLDILSSASLRGDELDEEVKRNKALTDVSKQITDVHRIALDAIKLDIEYGGGRVPKELSNLKDVDNGEG